MDKEKYSLFARNLIDSILSSPLVKKEFIFSLNSEPKNGHFEILETIISDHLAHKIIPQQKNLYRNSISSSTLKRIYKGSFINSTIDVRQRKSLDSLAYFLGYENFASFIEDHNKNQTMNAAVQLSSNTFDQLKMIILAYLEAEMNTYKKLPQVDMSELIKYIPYEGQLYNSIFTRLNRLHNLRWVIDNNRYPSHYNLYDIKVRSENHLNNYTIGTLENWVLNWVDPTTGLRVQNYNETNYQLYTVSYENDQFIIQSNSYPISQEIYLKL